VVGIPESQLEVWARQGATVSAVGTYASVRKALLEMTTSPVRYKDVDVYLQGSYRNRTNIRGDSDIDVVVQLNSTWSRDLSGLSGYEAELYRGAYPNATYLWHHFREDVLSALRGYYGREAVSEGNKCLKIAAGTGRLSADVVVCQTYRKYERFYGIHDQSYVEGIKFWDRKDGREVVNFPKAHHDNGAKKNGPGRTGGGYKPTVRIFKNARTHLIKRGEIEAGLAPSYFLECLLYNAPDSAFSVAHHQTFLNVLNWLYSVDLSSLRCQNEQTLLFGPTPEQWNTTDARALIGALRRLWNGWS
jgi:Nucleotidyltransferase domain